jgi:uncharacterized protein YceK
VPEEGRTVTHASWPGPARKIDKPTPERDELLAEVLRQLGLEFAGFGIALVALLALLALAGCVTRVSFDVPLHDGTHASGSYFSTKAQKWALTIDPTTHAVTATVNADTPTGWSGQDAGAFAQGLLTGAGSAIGAGISAAAGKPPTPPIVVRPPAPAPVPAPLPPVPAPLPPFPRALESPEP